MKRVTFVIMFLVVAALLASARIIPDTLFIKYGPTHFEREYVSSFLGDEDLAEILAISRERGHYGSWNGGPPISLFEYFFTYPKVGILAILPVDPAQNNGCDNCSVKVDIGVICGGLCGYGAIFYFEKTESGWAIDSNTVWVS